MTKHFIFQDDVPVAPVFGGRGKLLLMDQYLKELKISRPTSTREENDAQAGGDGLARPVVADVVVPEIEEEEEIVLKRGKAGNNFYYFTKILLGYVKIGVILRNHTQTIRWQYFLCWIILKLCTNVRGSFSLK